MEEQYENRVPNPSFSKLASSEKVVHCFESLGNTYFDIDSDKDLSQVKVLEFLHLAFMGSTTEIIGAIYSSEVEKRKRDITSLMINNFTHLSGCSLSAFN